MGMLMHHTWLEQQKNAESEKPVAENEVTEEVKEEPEQPVKRAGGRRKTK